MRKVTNLTSTKIRERLKLIPKQEKVLTDLADALDAVYENGMGAKEIAVILQDIGPTVLNSVYQWQPFAFFAVFIADELFLSQLEALINEGQDSERGDQLTRDQQSRLGRFRL